MNENTLVRSFPIIMRPDTWLTPDELGTKFPIYEKTFDFGGPLIDQFHQEIINQSGSGMYRTDVSGWLRMADALKLYEMAYFSRGDILELGSYEGLSSYVMATALVNAASQYRITSVDLHATAAVKSSGNLARKGLHRLVDFVTSDGTKFLDQAIRNGTKYGFVFIDHSHTQEHVREAAERVGSITAPGAFVLFHDFNDARNNDPQNKSIGVYSGVIEGLDNETFKFAGVFGCTALFWRS